MAREYRFGDWWLDATTGELRHGDRLHRLQEQPLRLLLALLERPLDVVSKDELCVRLWPDGSRVDYEHGIGNALHKLREALGDSAAEPRFIETVPRRGYRFMVRVESDPAAATDGRDRDERAAPPAGTLRREGAKDAGLRGIGELRPAIDVRRAGAVLAVVVVTGWGAWTALGRNGRDGPGGWPSPLDAAAREAYLRGEHLLARKTSEDVARGAAYFREAIERDPGFADAWASLAYAYHFMGALGVLEPEDAYRRSSEAAHAALGIEPELARASAILAETIFRFGPGGEAAEEWFLRALRLDPNSAETHHWYGNYLASRGDSARALDELERARELDPLDLHVSVDLAAQLYDVGRHDEARERLAQTLELDSHYPKTHYLAGWIALREGRSQEAVQAFRRTVELAPDVPKFIHALASAAIGAGQRDEAHRLLAQLAATDRHVPPELILDLESKLEAAPPPRSGDIGAGD